MEVRTDAEERVKREAFWSFPKDAGRFAFWYISGFAAFRFDLFNRHSPWFLHPMPTSRAGWVALPFALVLWLAPKLKRSAQ